MSNKIYLIILTFKKEVQVFIEGQTKTIQSGFFLHCKALEEEYQLGAGPSDLVRALTINQGWIENPRFYYDPLLYAFFGLYSKEGMEENKRFKELFIHNLHPYTKHHLGIIADPNLYE